MKPSKKITLQVVGLSVLVLTAYQNCAPGTLNSQSSSSVSAESFGECDGGLCEVVDQKVVAVSNSQNMLNSMLQQAGVQEPSATTRNTFNTQSSKISESGRAETITAPMWVAVATVSSEVCNDLYNQERVLAPADRRIYSAIDFTKGYASITTQAKDDVIRKFARSFWARNESGQEKVLIRGSLDEAFGGKNAVADTQAAALYICAAMLSSLKAHAY